MKPVGLSGDHPSWKLNVCYYRITETTSLEDIQHQLQLKWIAHVTQRENNDILKLSTFHTNSNKRLGRKRPSLIKIYVIYSYWT